MRTILFIAFLTGQIFAQSLVQRLAAPIFYELGIEPSFQSNPLNLSDLEIEKATRDVEYLNGIDYSSSNVLTFSAKMNYSPRLYGGRKTRFYANLNHHYYHDIPQRHYQTYSVRIKQSLGKYRYLDVGYWILPEYYLRNYRLQDNRTLETTREVCKFGTDRLSLGFEQRITRKNTIEYGLAHRSEIYQAPFSHYDLSMMEADLKINIGQFSTFDFRTVFQYGIAENDNNYDDKDRSYRYLNIRPSLTLRLPGKHRIRIATRYEQRAYRSEQYDDQLHAGRYQEEYRLDLSLFPHLESDFSLEPYFGYRERLVDSIDPSVRDLKSFQRYWFGIQFGFKSVIDMYF